MKELMTDWNCNPVSTQRHVHTAHMNYQHKTKQKALAPFYQMLIDRVNKKKACGFIEGQQYNF